jgi:hypothetical protein
VRYDVLLPDGNVQLTSLSVPGYGVTSSKSAGVAHDGDRLPSTCFLPRMQICYTFPDRPNA